MNHPWIFMDFMCKNHVVIGLPLVPGGYNCHESGKVLGKNSGWVREKKTPKKPKKLRYGCICTKCQGAHHVGDRSWLCCYHLLIGVSQCALL